MLEDTSDRYSTAMEGADLTVHGTADEKQDLMDLVTIISHKTSNKTKVHPAIRRPPHRRRVPGPRQGVPRVSQWQARHTVRFLSCIHQKRVPLTQRHAAC